MSDIIAGQEIGGFYVLHRTAGDYSSSRGAFWLVMCSECREQFATRATTLRRLRAGRRTVLRCPKVLTHETL